MGNMISLDYKNMGSQEGNILSKEHKKAIMAKFGQFSKELCPKDYSFIKTEVPKKLRGVSGSQEFIFKLANRVKLFYEILYDYSHQAPLPLVKSAAAGLKYFVSPRDFLSDEIPGLGYLDDAYVLRQVLIKNYDDAIAFMKEQDLDPCEYF